MSEEKVLSNHKRRAAARKAENQAARPSARGRYTRGSAQKAREVADLIRGKNVNLAISILRTCKRRAAASTLRALQSAMANAVDAKKLKVEDLFVAQVWVDQGPAFRRFLPRARGRADRILKRTHHTTIVLGERK